MPNHRLIQLLERFAVCEGLSSASLPGICFFRSTKPIPRCPKVYQPSIVIIGQGRKREYLKDEVYTYDSGNYLVHSVPLPLECETVEASAEKPALAVSLPVDLVTLGELLVEMNDQKGRDEKITRGIYASPLSDEVIDGVIRLLESLKSPMDSRILGPQIIREVIYRVLCSENGWALRTLANRHSHFHRIAGVLKRMHLEYAKRLDIKTLANEASMSISTFHHNFKMVTAISPLQYLKNIRLHKARILMLQDGLNAGLAAVRVGYESTSQFNREFKRLFGSTPVHEAVRLREINKLSS